MLLKKFLIFLFIIASFINISYAESEPNVYNKEIITLLDKSEAYYWAALDNGGYKRLLIDSRTSLEEAKSLFEANKNKLSEESIAQISLQIKSLTDDLQTQESVYGKRFSTRYHLTKFLGGPIILTGGVVNNHFFFYSPVTSTIGKGIQTLIELVTLTAGEISESQFDVVILASEEHQSRIGWLAHNFDNTNGVFYTLTTRYINNVLAQNATEETIKLFLEGTLNDEAISILSSQLSNRNLLVISFDQMPANDGDIFFNINGDIYSNTDGTKVHSMTTMAFGFAYANTLLGISYINFLMLLLAILWTLLIFKYFNYNNTLTLKKVLYTSFYGFLLGRFSSWIAMPALSAYSPPTDKASYDSLPLLLFSIPSYLWLISISVTIFLVPIILPRLIAHPFLKKYAHLPSVSGKGAFFAVGSLNGIFAYLALPFLINNSFNDLIVLIPVYLALLFASYILGRSILDEKDEFSEIYSIPIVIGIIGISFPLFGNQLELASILSIALIVISSLIVLRVQKNEKLNISRNIVEKQVDIDSESSKDLITLSENPIYKKFQSYLTILSEAESKLVDSDCNYLAISGPPGSGKTITLKNLIADINKSSEDPVLYFQGECKKTEEAELPTPYDVFHQALGSTLTLDLFDQRTQDDSINSVINSAGNLLLGPIGAVLSSETSDDAPSFSDDDIYAFIQEKLTTLSEKSIIIFHLDDIQWIDSKSEALLSKLLEYFNNTTRVLFLLGFRDEGDYHSILDRINVDKSLINSLTKLNIDEQIELLTEGVNLSNESAIWISSWLSQRDDGEVYPADLIDAVDHLARNDFFIDTKSGFVLTKDFDKSNPPIPGGVMQATSEIFKNNPDMKDLISIAAYIGKEFKVSIIRKCLEISRLTTIQKLDQIANSCGLFFDVMNKDDVYSFRSQAFLDATRLVIGHTDEGSNISKVPQHSRNYHALIAESIQSLDSKNPDDVYLIAKHFFAAGSLFSAQAYESNLQAAKLACKFHQFEDSLDLLEKAKISASSSGNSVLDVDVQIAVVHCEKSHIYGKDQSEAADFGLEILKEASLLIFDELAIKVTRALYESRRYDEAIEMAEKLKSAENLSTQTEGFHFHGLSISPQERDKSKERLSLLRQAYDLASQSNISSLEAMVANSLAGQLSGGNDSDRVEAKELYFRSLELKENQEIKDVKGIAMTHGGLGFFSFFGKPQDLESARFHFEKDLELATQINGEMGMSKMNSMLSQIDIIENKIQSAIARSIVVLNLDNNPFDTGKAIEALCNIAKIDLGDDFNPMEVDICNYLKRIHETFLKHKEVDFKNAAKDLADLMNNRCK